VLEVKGLRKEFGQLVAVKDIHFTLQPGDIFGYIGPNGAGKTTTLRMLATLLEPTAGTAIVNGIDIVKSPEEARPLIGFMPDFFGLYEGITAWEYLAFFAEAYGDGMAFSSEKRKSAPPFSVKQIFWLSKSSLDSRR